MLHLFPLQIMRELGFSYVISYLAAFFVVFGEWLPCQHECGQQAASPTTLWWLPLPDNALVIQSRVIMLDSMAILFTFLTILFYLKFCNCQRSAPGVAVCTHMPTSPPHPTPRSWSGWWYLYLFLSAVSLGSLMG